MSECKHVITAEATEIDPSFTGVLVYETKDPIQAAEADVVIRYYVKGVVQACTYFTVLPRTKVHTECVFDRTGSVIDNCKITKKYDEVLLCNYDAFGNEMENDGEPFMAED